MDFDPLAASDRPAAEETNPKAGYDLWGVVSSVASQVAVKSAEVARICTEEFHTFATEVKLEASDIYRQHLAAPVRQAKDLVPTLLPASVKTVINRQLLAGTQPPADSIGLERIELTIDFMLAQHAAGKDNRWPPFLALDATRPPLGEQQQQAILANDQHLHHLHRQLVPDALTDQDFWLKWRYWRYCLAHPAGKLDEGQDDFSLIPPLGLNHLDNPINLNHSDNSCNLNHSDNSCNLNHSDNSGGPPQRLPHSNNNVGLDLDAGRNATVADEDDDWDSWE